MSPFLDGDTNADGLVNIHDLNNVRNTFGCTLPSLCTGDADGDTDIDDLNAVRNNFGAATPAPISQQGEHGSRKPNDLVKRRAELAGRPLSFAVVDMALEELPAQSLSPQQTKPLWRASRGHAAQRVWQAAWDESIMDFVGA